MLIATALTWFVGSLGAALVVLGALRLRAHRGVADGGRRFGAGVLVLTGLPLVVMATVGVFAPADPAPPSSPYTLGRGDAVTHHVLFDKEGRIRRVDPEGIRISVPPVERPEDPRTGD